MNDELAKSGRTGITAAYTEDMLSRERTIMDYIIDNALHYKTNSRVIRRIIRFGLVLELSGLVVRTIWLIVRIISSP